MENIAWKISENKMEIYEWIEFHNEIWSYLNWMIAIFLDVTHLGNLIYSIIRK